MKIFHMDEAVEREWTTDPVRGLVQVEKRTARPSGFYRIATPDGKVYNADEPGTFDVPDELAQQLLRQPGWHEGQAPSLPGTPPAPAPGPKRPAKLASRA